MINDTDVVNIIKEKFYQNDDSADIPMLKHGSFKATLSPDGIYVSNLKSMPFLPWAVFTEAISLLKRKGGRAQKGNAMVNKLGEDGLSLDSVEGYIANNVYGKQVGETVFRRITPIACILVWAGICSNEPGKLVLSNPQIQGEQIIAEKDYVKLQGDRNIAKKDRVKIKLYDLAFICYLYGTYNFDESYLAFLKATSNSPDLNLAEHRKALLVWLNQWGCRQFALDCHELASDEILSWYSEFSNYLPQKEKHLWELTEDDFEKIGIAFNALVNKTASYKTRSNESIRVTVGSTGAAKTLYAIRPNSLAPWDDPIRTNLLERCDINPYISYLKIIKADLLDLERECLRQGFTLLDLPRMMGRPLSTPPVLIDEYYWVTITRKCKSPDLDTLKTWVKWAEDRG
ncbi:MAG: hypothetical protein HPY50_04105 [Firmicutes bacterium]|nr:hypothetical protein [Bacillota bacterium]